LIPVSQTFTGDRPSLHLSGHTSDRAISMMSSRGGRVLPVPGDTEFNLEIDASHLLQLETAVRKILCPFRHEADAKAKTG
jgi:hypothetical protein